MLEQNSDITVAAIAEHLGTSSRTIHRDLQAVEEQLTRLGITLQKKSGSGIRIFGPAEKLVKLQNVMYNKVPVELNAEERRLLTLCILLEQKEPLKLFSLAHELGVTMPTIGTDLDELEQIITLHQLQLIRRRGYGVELSGQEIHKRKLIKTLVFTYLDESMIINQELAQESVQPVSNRLLQMIGHSYFNVLEDLLWKMQDKLLVPLNEQAYTNLLLQISIALTRYVEGHPLQQSFSQTDQNHHLAGVTSKTSETNAAIQLIEHLIAQLPIDLPAEEQLYIQSLIEQAFQHEEQLHLYVEQPYLAAIIEQLSLFVEQHTGESVSGDRSLADGLLQHLLPATQRMKDGLHIRNPMLSQIKKDYLKLFTVISIGVKQFMPHLHVPDEEIGYITMHYGASIERLKQLPHRFRAVLVCMSGIGSSKLLAIRLNKEFPQIELIGHFSWFEAARLPESSYDFIISTVDLPINPDQYIKLSPLVTQEEVKKLEQFIKGFSYKEFDTKENSPLSSVSTLHWLQQVQLLSNVAVQIIDQFAIYPCDIKNEKETVHQMLPQMLMQLKDSHHIEDIEAIVEHLRIREEQGSIVLPETDVALMHTRLDSVTSPILVLYRFEKPVLLKENDDTTVKHILLMLAPRKLDHNGLEILSEISAMLLVPEMITVLQSGVLLDIKSYILTQLEKYIKHKLDWRD